MSFKLLLLQLGFTCSTAADRLRLILSDFQCLRAFSQGFPLFFRLFLLRSARKSADIYEKYQFLVFFGATDRNFTEKYSVTTASYHSFYKTHNRLPIQLLLNSLYLHVNARLQSFNSHLLYEQ